MFGPNVSEYSCCGLCTPLYGHTVDCTAPHHPPLSPTWPGCTGRHCHESPSPARWLHTACKGAKSCKAGSCVAKFCHYVSSDGVPSSGSAPLCPDYDMFTCSIVEPGKVTTSCGVGVHCVGQQHVRLARSQNYAKQSTWHTCQHLKRHCGWLAS